MTPNQIAVVVFDDARTRLGLQNRYMHSDTYAVALEAILAALKAQQPDEGVVERVAELQLAAFLAGRGSVKSMQYGARSAAHAPSMDDFRSMAIAAMQESP